MPPSNHALLGASSAARWLNCTPSARWELEFPEPPETDAAEEGTFAHALAEDHLGKAVAGKKMTTPAKVKEGKWYTKAMEEHIATYVGYIMERYNEARSISPDALIGMEQRVDYSAYVPEGFGTCDCYVLCDGHLQIFDLKYGKGIPVDAHDNPQIRLYAIGMLEQLDCLYAIDKVSMHIIQPRLDNISSEEMSAEDLRSWAETYVKPRAKQAWEGGGEFNPGEKQCQWCRCKNVCRAYSTYQLQVVQYQFKDGEHESLPAELDEYEIAAILDSEARLTKWLKSVKEYALEQARSGRKFPGFKLVEGRSSRKIVNEPLAREILLREGFREGDITALVGIGELEDLVGKNQLSQLLGDIIEKPVGKPVLVPESDKRPELNSAEEAKKVFAEN